MIEWWVACKFHLKKYYSEGLMIKLHLRINSYNYKLQLFRCSFKSLPLFHIISYANGLEESTADCGDWSGKEDCGEGW